MFPFFSHLTVPDANLAVPPSPLGIPSVTPSSVTSAKLSSSKAESEKDACEASLSQSWNHLENIRSQDLIIEKNLFFILMNV